MKLYEISADYREVMEAIEAADGELTPELEARLDAVNVALGDKVDVIGAVVRNKMSEWLAYSEEARRLQAKAKAALNTANNLKDYFARNLLVAVGMEKASGRLFSARVAEASVPQIRWESSDPIPVGFQRVTVELDGKAAQEAYKHGVLPDGFTATRKTYLDLR